MLIIFDCDGVLIDSEIVAARLEAEAITALGLPMTAQEICTRFAGTTTREVWATLERELGRPLPAGFFETHLAHVRDVFSREIEAIPGVHTVIERLEVPYCVASSTQLPSLITNLGTAGLAHLFDGHLYSASQVKRPKPAPDVFLFAASQMGSDPADCLVIEDSLAGVTAARRAGMPVIGFTGGSHVGPGHAERLIEVGAASTFERMTDLPAILAARGFRRAA
ncbi:HAD family hydrolase [Pinisolibacter aquiterrae]|uniref:HAD family hydrolase n=1 Tax=Pinisolibacter aquiterrae TaxID=2815579 RepID=UPI001C3CFCCC|nr:HAD family hydrolase [Pinisolibacter aquiterrae]MBV5266531.1 HAD family hydrolase [Pinisolibacter aquiterrae]MCC8234612.1 HAD family hydrolase [Pinisolibacter aquiterrae]